MSKIELNGQDAAVVIRGEDQEVLLYAPKQGESDLVPEYIVILASVAARICQDLEWRQEMIDWIQKRSAN